MKYVRYSALMLIFALSGCLQQTRQDLAQCTSQAQARYPAGTSVPQGQPFKDIYGCMWNTGYDLDSHLTECHSSDYTAAVTDAVCYRPKNFFTGFIYDLSMLGHF